MTASRSEGQPRIAWLAMAMLVSWAGCALAADAVPNLTGTWKGTGQTVGSGQRTHARPTAKSLHLYRVHHTNPAAARPRVLRHHAKQTRERTVRRGGWAGQVNLLRGPGGLLRGHLASIKQAGISLSGGRTEVAGCGLRRVKAGEIGRTSHIPVAGLLCVCG
jgi:hypothetical protein